MLHAFGAYALVLFAECLNVIDKCGVFCELNVSHGLAERFLRKLCFGERLSTQKLLADGIIFICIAAPLIQECVVVVACYSRLIAFIVICACGKAEVCAAVEHIEIKACAASEHIFQLGYDRSGSSVMVLFSEVVKPAVPKFTAHARCLEALIFLELSE